MKIIVTIGDIHGCVEELNELLKTIQYNKNNMRLVFLGDLVHRGPDTLGVVRKVRELGTECVKGNHEDKLLRWRLHEAKERLTGKINPMKRISESEKFANKSLSEDDLDWMTNLPLSLDLGNNWWAVHAGCEPRFTLANQSERQIIRVRYVNDEGIAQSLGPNWSQPAGSKYWTELWKGPESIVYGHCVHSESEPRIDQISDTVTCIGLDTGCVFGGALTGMLFDPMSPTDKQFVQVKAKEIYYPRYGDEE